MMEFQLVLNRQKGVLQYLNSKHRNQMPRRSHKQPRKWSEEEGQGRVRYQEKRHAWRCSVCEQVYDQNIQYCLACYQSLYYFSYINNQLFVAKDDSYLQTYFHQQADPADEARSEHSHDDTEDSHESEDVNLDWVENLLM